MQNDWASYNSHLTREAIILHKWTTTLHVNEVPQCSVSHFSLVILPQTVKPVPGARESEEGGREADDRLTFVLVWEWEERRGKFERRRSPAPSSKCERTAHIK